jgi:hypothetical protein
MEILQSSARGAGQWSPGGYCAALSRLPSGLDAAPCSAVIRRDEASRRHCVGMTAASHAERPSHSGARPRRCDSVHRHIRAPTPPARCRLGGGPRSSTSSTTSRHNARSGHLRRRRIPHTMRLAIQTDFRHGDRTAPRRLSTSHCVMHLDDDLLAATAPAAYGLTPPTGSARRLLRADGFREVKSITRRRRARWHRRRRARECGRRAPYHGRASRASSPQAAWRRPAGRERRRAMGAPGGARRRRG